MHSTKRNTNGWILCPSNSFPGKFYYFNVLTGETAWSPHDADKANIKKDSYIHKVSNKHCYPEPSNPPDDQPYTSSTNMFNQPKNQYSSTYSRQTHSTPVFGQATFSKYVSNVGPYMPNMVWSLVPMPMMLNPVAIGTDDKQMSNKVTQTITEQCAVHTCKLSLNERFTKSELNTSMNLNEGSPIWTPNTYIESNERSVIRVPKTKLDSNMQSVNLNPNTKPNLNNTKFNLDKSHCNFEPKMFQSTPNKEFCKNSSTFKRVRTKSESTINDTDNSLCFESLFGKGKYEHMDIFKNSITKSLTNMHKVHNSLSANQSSSNAGEIENAADFDLSQVLDENDLRHKLVARRRRSVDIGEFLGNRANAPIRDNDNDNTASKHKNWFCSDDDEKSDSPVQDNLNISNEANSALSEEMTLPYQNLIETLRNLAKPNSNSVWYIVADKDVLLEHFEFIEQFVKQDNNCRLVIPYIVQSEIKVISLGDSRGRLRATDARRVVRRLATAPAHIIVQPDDKLEFQISSSEKIIQCCMQALSQRFHVVLVTNDAELVKKSKCNNIHTLTTKEIQNGQLLDNSFERIKKIKISVENTSKENLFMQPPSYFKSHIEHKNEMPVDCFKRNLFDQTNNKIVDKSTSPIDFEEIKNKTQTNRKANTAYINNTAAKASEISQGIENLKIHLNKEQDDFHSNVQVLRTFDIQNDRQNPCKSSVAIVMEKPNRLDSSIDEEIKSFCNDGLLEERVKCRIDEWCCIFTQIMEEALFEVIKKSQTANSTGILSLHEAVSYIGDVYASYPRVRCLVRKLSDLIASWEKSKPQFLNAAEFMRLLQCGILFLQALKSILPEMEELMDAEESLSNLLDHIQAPNSDDSLQIKIPSAHLSRSELDAIEPRPNFIKKPTEIINYLKQNFPAWKSYDEKDTSSLPRNNLTTNIIRTTGANLDKLTLRITKDNSKNTITNIVNTTNKLATEPKIVRVFDNVLFKKNTETVDANQEHRISKVFDKIKLNNIIDHNAIETEQLFKGISKDTESNDKIKQQKINRVKSNDTNKVHKINRVESNDSIKVHKTNRVSRQDIDRNGGPKVIRNIKLLDAFEERLRNKESESSRDSGIINNDLQYDGSSSLVNCSVIGSKDNCFGSGSEEAYCLAKTYLVKLSVTLKRIYQFAQNTIKEFRTTTVSEQRNNIILDKTDRLLTEMNNIIELLKCIAERESHQNTELKSLILQNGDSACDKRMTNYGKVASKCLEQAVIMRNVLKIITSLADDDITDSTKSVTTNMSYINIFE